jgi:hypothetical protein
VHLLRDTVAEWRDVPRSTYGVYHIEDVPALFRGAASYANTHGFPAAFPNCHQQDHGQGVVYGTILLKPGTVEWSDVPRSTLGNPDPNDVRAMMTAAANYAWANGYVAAFPTFFGADYGAGIVHSIVLFPPGSADWRDVLIEDLYFQEPKLEQTCIVLCRFRNDDGTLTAKPAEPDFYRDFFLARGSGGLTDFYRDVTHGRVNLVGDVFGWLDIGHTVAEHKAMQAFAQRVQAFDWGLQAARNAGFGVDAYARQVVVINQDTDWGGISRGRSMLLPHSPTSPWSHSRAAHEFGHVLGLNDAFSTTVTPTGVVDSQYTDDHCIMSYAGLGHHYQAPVDGVSMETGPGLNGVYAHELDGIPPSRIYAVPATGAAETVRLAPLTHADEDGALLIRVPPIPSRPHTYWVEYHHKSHWDRAIPSSRVAIHESRAGDDRSFELVVSGGRQELSDINDEAITTPDGSIGVHLAALNRTAADIRIWEFGPSRTHEMRIANVIWDPPSDDVAGERVLIRNDRLRTIALAGWSLRDDKQHSVQPPWRYDFPNIELAPGEDLTIWTKAGTNDSHNLFWGLNHAVWNNRGGDTAVLADAAGTEISRFSY